MRKNIFKESFRVLRNKLKIIAGREILSPMEKLNEGMFLINGFLDDVRKQVTTVPFKDLLEEIYFFKFEKPEFYALKIYHVALFTLVSQCPAGPDELIREYYVEELRFISRFFRQHAFYYGYYRSGFTEMDDSLFVRGRPASFPLTAQLPELDEGFATPGDYLFAKFMAYEDLQEYILSELKGLEQRGNVVLNDKGKPCFEWTGELINLVELGYAVWLSGQIGEGKAGLQEIFNWLEQSFGVEIGIPANRFREIKRRKRLSRTRFIDFCKDSLIVYMDEDDAYRPEGNFKRNGLG